MVSTSNEKLIFLVQQNPCLYDPSDRDYKNLVKKQYIWDKIAKEIQHNREATKMKWKNLKDGYTKYKNQTNGTSQKKTYVNWIWGPNLQFLDTVKKFRRNTTANDDDFILTEDVLNSPSRSSISDSAQISAYMEDESQDASASAHNQASPQSSKKRKADSQESIMEYLNSLKRNDRDGVDHLFASYAETFKKLKPRTQASVKVKLAQLFAEAEINDLDSHNEPLMSPEFPVYLSAPNNDNESGFEPHSQISSENAVKIKQEDLM